METSSFRHPLLSEIIFGIALIANYKVRWTAIPLIIILLVATLFVHVKWAAFSSTSWGTVIQHLTLVSMLWVYAAYDKK